MDRFAHEYGCTQPKEKKYKMENSCYSGQFLIAAALTPAG
jgi:hypothetical protein